LEKSERVAVLLFSGLSLLLIKFLGGSQGLHCDSYAKRAPRNRKCFVSAGKWKIDFTLQSDMKETDDFYFCFSRVERFAGLTSLYAITNIQSTFCMCSAEREL
jgi:hypothetical protein